MKLKPGILNGIAMLFIIRGVFACSTPEERVKQIQKATGTKTHTVVIQQMKFAPAELIVNEGDSVTWINRDIVDHNVTEEANKQWTSGNLPLGKTWSMVVIKSANYFCSLHPVMKGSVTVK
jgi:plastocyanin